MTVRRGYFESISNCKFNGERFEQSRTIVKGLTLTKMQLFVSFNFSNHQQLAVKG